MMELFSSANFWIAVATTIYCVVTAFMWHEMRMARRVQASPVVLLFARFVDEPFDRLDLVIRNGGQGPAFDVKILTKEPIPRLLGGDEVFEDGPLVTGVPVLAPGEEVRIHWTAGVPMWRAVESRLEIPVSVQSTDFRGRRHVVSCRLQLGSVERQRFAKHDSLDDVVAELRSLRVAVEELTSEGVQ